MDFVRRWSEKTEIGAGRFIVWLNITASKFYDWRERYGKGNEHNGWVPPRLLAGGLGKAGHHRLSSGQPIGRLPAAHIHDARRRHRGSESDERMARDSAEQDRIAYLKKKIRQR